MSNEKYWKDSKHGDSEIFTPVLSKKIGRRIREKALSGKQKRLFDDEIKKCESVTDSVYIRHPLGLRGTSSCKRPSNLTDSACYKRPSGLIDSGNRTRPSCSTGTSNRKRPSSIADSTYRTRPTCSTGTSNHMLPSRITDSAYLTCPSSLKQNHTTLIESRDSDDPEKRVYNKSFSASKTSTSPGHRTRNVGYEYRHPAISSPRKTSRKKNMFSVSKSDASKVVSDNAVEEEIASISIRRRDTNNSYTSAKNLGTRVPRNSKAELVLFSSREEELDIITAGKLVPVRAGRQSMDDHYHQIPKNQLKKFSKNNSLQRSSRTSKLAENVKSGSDIEFNGNDLDNTSFMLEEKSVTASVPQHLPSKKNSKNKKLNTPDFSTTKIKFNVIENAENNHKNLEQEFEAHSNSSPRSKINKLGNVQKNKAMSQQRSLRRKNSDDGNEIYSNFATDFSRNGNETDGAAVNVYQHFPSEKLSKSKQLYSSNSLTTKRKIFVSENTERDPENYEKISEERDLELELRAPKEERLTRNLGKAVMNVPSDQLKQSKRNGNALLKVPSDQLRQSKRDGNTVLKVPSEQLRKSKRAGNVVPSDQLRRSKRDRIAPLKYWANERRLFSYNRRTGEITNLGIDPGTGEDDECQRYLQRKQEERQQDNVKKTARKSIHKPSSVINRRTGKTEPVVLHFPFDSISWKPPFGIDGNGANSDYFLSKPCNSNKLTFGFLKIRPLKIKPNHISPVGSIFFQVVVGRIKVTIHKTVLELKRLDSFIVPKYQTYSIENLKNSNALLSFCTFKVPFFDYEFK